MGLPGHQTDRIPLPFFEPRADSPLFLPRSYDLLYTPHIARAELWETSGHASFYRDSMFDPITVEGEAYQLRPMNCPFHVQVRARC